MGKKKVEHFFEVLKLFMFLQLYGNFQKIVEATEIEIGTAVAKFQSDDEISLKARMTQIEMKSLQQDKEISNLKTKAEEDKKVISHLEDRVSMLEALSFFDPKTKVNDGNLRRQKRPFRLIPPHQTKIGAINKESDESWVSNPPFYGPPTSCSDLGKLGYTLNGFYMVKRNSNSQSSVIATVFCSFKQKQKDQRLETLIGNVEIKTKSVHFFVQRNTTFNLNGIITFEIERLNVGGALNLTTGIFTAPVAGIYHFQFCGLKDFSSDYFAIHFQLNGNQISYSAAGKWRSHINSELTVMNGIHVSLRLKMGDRINLFKEGHAALADLIYYPATHFTGSLLEEDIEFA